MVWGLDFAAPHRGSRCGTWGVPDRTVRDCGRGYRGGTAPVEVTSGQSQDRHRLNRGGDRQLNWALYFVAVTRQRCCPVAKDYMARRTSEGKTEREATRCLKRFIARHAFSGYSSTPNCTLTRHRSIGSAVGHGVERIADLSSPTAAELAEPRREH